MNEELKNLKEQIDNNIFDPKPWAMKKWKTSTHKPEEETPTVGTIFIDQKKNRIILKSMGEDVDLGAIGDIEEIAKNLSAYIAKKMLESVK